MSADVHCMCGCCQPDCCMPCQYGCTTSAWLHYISTTAIHRNVLNNLALQDTKTMTMLQLGKLSRVLPKLVIDSQFQRVLMATNRCHTWGGAGCLGRRWRGVSLIPSGQLAAALVHLPQVSSALLNHNGDVRQSMLCSQGFTMMTWCS